MRRLIFTIMLELYALLLAWVQSFHGIFTDEAKYLLNIPYPHPPLARFFLGLTSGWPMQEMFWRVIFATLVVQAAWLVWSMARGLSDEQRFALSCLWLLSASVVLQAGSIMMAPLTALQGLIFVALIFSLERRRKSWGPWQTMGVALLWLLSLLTAFQAVLYGPLVLALLWRSAVPRWQRVLFLLGPLSIAVLTALANPLILSSFLQAGGMESGHSLLQRSVQLFQAWSIGGSVILGVVGVMGMILERRWSLIASFLLTGVFLFVSFRLYYAILFLPLFIAGALLFFRHLWRHPLPLLLPFAAITFLCLALFPPTLVPTPARATMQALDSLQGTGAVLIAGSFGHEWQYESSSPLLKYHPSLLPQARAVVCLESCEEVAKTEGWTQLPDREVEVWVRK